MKSIPEIIMNYRQMEQAVPNSSMLREVRWQYADMASGGDGGSLGFIPKGWTLGRSPSCREHNYPNHPDSFFQEVCDLMGWSR
jgi:hypothetical protein